MPDGSGMRGGWIMRAEDIEGLTPLQIQEKFALPNTPKYVCDVELEAGTHLRVGEANPLEGWGAGGGTQYDLMGQRIGNFTNERVLEVPNTGEAANPRIALPGDVDYVGPINEGSWVLTPDGEGAHLIEKANIKGRSELGKYNTTETPRYYPYGSPESAGQAHIRLHEATRNQGIKLRGGNPELSDEELIEKYMKAYNSEELSGIRGELRTPDSSVVIAEDVTPSEAYKLLLEWGNH